MVTKLRYGVSVLSACVVYALFIGFSTGLQSCYKFHEDECDTSVVCYTDKPDSGYVNITLTDLGSGGKIPLTIYKGEIDKGEIVVQDTIYGATEAYYYLPVKTKYSGKAIYKKAGITTIVYDGTKVSISKFWNCDERCYQVSEGYLDLQLKN